jgi:hypothetical protein
MAMADACALPCALCGRALTEATRGRECGGPKKGGGGSKRKRRSTGINDEDIDAGDDAGGAEVVSEEASSPKKKAKKASNPRPDEPDEPLAAELTDRQLLNRWTRMVEVAIGHTPTSKVWARTLAKQLGGVRGVATATRKQILSIKAKGNVQMPTALATRISQVFALPVVKKKTIPTVVEQVKKKGVKPTAAKPVMASRKIPRLPK